MIKSSGRSGRGSESVLAHMTGEPPRVQASEAELRTAARGRFTILVVDDTAASRYPIVRWLKHAGFETIEVETGIEAITGAAGASAVLLDVNLPDMNGVQVCSILRTTQEYKHLPIVLMSAYYGDQVHREAGLDAGADAYLAAPLDPNEVTAALDRLLGLV